MTNGDFEAGATSGVPTTAPGLTIYVFGVGGVTNIGGWTVSASSVNNGSSTPLSVLVTGNPPQIPAGGQYALDFDPYWNIATGALLDGTVVGTLPSISQTFSLPAGDYVLSFDGAVEQNGGPGTRSLDVTMTGAASLTETATTSETDDVGYTLFSYDVVSTGGQTTLTFTPDDFSPEPNFMLDNVSLTAPVSTPEPATFIPLAGLLGLVLAARKSGSLDGRGEGL